MSGGGTGGGPTRRRPGVTTGTVTDFDAEVGLGEVGADDGTVVRFHCTQIADGSRSIAVGTPVSFAVVPGRGGRWEAAAVAARAAG
ncbi:MAG TPA: cold shock domain-containing protein [Acidimicrobiales bacterium]|nr:cold shock domain-containing protein [Acidimicrobiales bacterium]